MQSVRISFLCFVVLLAFATRNCEYLKEKNTIDPVKENVKDDVKLEEKLNEDVICWDSEDSSSEESEESEEYEEYEESKEYEESEESEESKEYEESEEYEKSEEGLQIESISGKVLDDILLHKLLQFNKTGKITKQLKHDLRKFRGLLKEPFKDKILEKNIVNYFVELWDKIKEILQNVKETTFCGFCNLSAMVLSAYKDIGLPKHEVKKTLKLICSIYAEYKLNYKKSEEVCNGLIDLNMDIFLYILDNKPDLSSAKICYIISQSNNCSNPDNDNTWSVQIPPKVPNKQKIPTKTPGEKPIRILHITDIHYDDKYAIGANTDCGQPLCCGVNQGWPKSPEFAAGYWGDYRKCDMPFHAVANLMDAASKHDVDLIYFTGDIINHRVWETSKETNSRSIRQIIDLFRRKFPNKTVYHIAGNHESNPLNEFAPEHITRGDLSTHWLYDMLAKEWSTWLPRSTQQTIRKGGFYTVPVRPGFRIIALNSNVCYIYNWWLLYNDVDPYGQLQWLSDTLYQAELDNEVVHILTHIPSGDKECYKKWSHEYNRVVRRFAHIIKAQFVGHTHFNELHFFYNQNEEDPINVAFNGGSFTTYEKVNPNFRIYEVNPNTYQVEDYTDWIYNLTEANSYGNRVFPRWFPLPSFKQTYQLSSMDLPTLGQFVHTLARNQTRFDIYYSMRVLFGDASLKEGYDEDSKKKQLCALVTSEHGDVDRCNNLIREFREANSVFG